jgi:plastocyanin
MRSPLLAALTASLLLVGCGGSGDGKGSGASTPKTLEVDAGQMIEVTADEYSFGPSKVIVTAPDDHPVQVKFSLKNAGALPHDMTVLDGEDVLGATSIFGPGKTGEGQATLAAGSYKFVCSVGDHANLGMKGTLIVRAPAG